MVYQFNYWNTDILCITIKILHFNTISPIIHVFRLSTYAWINYITSKWLKLYPGPGFKMVWLECFIHYNGANREWAIPVLLYIFQWSQSWQNKLALPIFCIMFTLAFECFFFNTFYVKINKFVLLNLNYDKSEDFFNSWAI